MCEMRCFMRFKISFQANYRCDILELCNLCLILRYSKISQVYNMSFSEEKYAIFISLSNDCQCQLIDKRQYCLIEKYGMQYSK